MAKEYKCLICGKWFEPCNVCHDSAFWRGYSQKKYCSVECVGKADCEWRCSYTNHILRDQNYDSNLWGELGQYKVDHHE
jgi:hypothetical protein